MPGTSKRQPSAGAAVGSGVGEGSGVAVGWRLGGQRTADEQAQQQGKNGAHWGGLVRCFDSCPACSHMLYFFAMGA